MRQSFLGKKFFECNLKTVSKTCTKMCVHCFKKRVLGTFSPILEYINYIQNSKNSIAYSKSTIIVSPFNQQLTYKRDVHIKENL